MYVRIKSKPVMVEQLMPPLSLNTTCICIKFVRALCEMVVASDLVTSEHRGTPLL